MRVHHIDCATMCPLSRRLINGDGGYFEPARLVAHCLLVETDGHGLILVDTGVGSADVRDPKGRLGAAFVAAVGMGKAPIKTAAEHVTSRGYALKDVRHILVTHLDLDHAGGLGDFPDATVHVHQREHDAALSPSWRERERYRACHWAHGPKWAPYASTGEPWMGFAAVRDLPGLPPEVLAVPMPGHTRGHACIAVKSGAEWLLHAGDAFFHRSAVEPGSDPMPAGLRAFEGLIAMDRSAVHNNHARLRDLARDHGGEVRVFCAHDPVQFDRMAG
jgi:glyoxylase-like metal-dependent hydrolase (beta-lactamase superfamily II)